MNILTFQLYAPFASWGDIAVSGQRDSNPFPSKSAMVGFLAAALGIDRNDPLQERLANSYQFAFKVISEGILIEDFQTAQAGSSKKNTFYTRVEELDKKKSKVSTVLSRKEYQCDFFAVVSVIAAPEAPFSLSEIKEALDKPVFHLYLGRKCNPLAWPMCPKVADFNSPIEALDKVTIPKVFYRLKRKGAYYWEGDIAGQLSAMTIERYDHPLSRSRWQFASRKIQTRPLIGGEDVSFEN